MRCEICDYDEVTGGSSYTDTSGYVDVNDKKRGHDFRTRKTGGHLQGGGKVVEDQNTGQYLCSACRGEIRDNLLAMELLDIEESEEYNLSVGELNGQEDKSSDEERPEWEPSGKNEV